MSHGLKVLSSSGAVQLTELGTYLRVASSGSVGRSADGANKVPGDCLGPNSFGFIRSSTTGPNTTGEYAIWPTYNFQPDSPIFPYFDGANTSYTYYGNARTIQYVRAVDSGWGTDGSGLKVVNPSGGVVFNSNDNFVVVTSVISVTFTASSLSFEAPISIAPYTNKLPYAGIYTSGWFSIMANGVPTAYVLNLWFNSTNTKLLGVAISLSGTVFPSYAPTSFTLTIPIVVML